MSRVPLHSKIGQSWPLSRCETLRGFMEEVHGKYFWYESVLEKPEQYPLPFFDYVMGCVSEDLEVNHGIILRGVTLERPTVEIPVPEVHEPTDYDREEWEHKKCYF